MELELDSLAATPSQEGFRRYWRGIAIRMLEEFLVAVVALLVVVSLLLPGDGLSRVMEILVEPFLPVTALLLLSYSFLVHRLAGPVRRLMERFCEGNLEENEISSGFTLCSELPRRIFVAGVVFWMIGTFITSWLVLERYGFSSALPTTVGGIIALLTLNLVSFHRNKDAMVPVVRLLARKLRKGRPIPSFVGSEFHQQLQFILLVFGAVVTLLGTAIVLLQLNQFEVLSTMPVGTQSFRDYALKAIVGLGFISLLLGGIFGRLLVGELKRNVRPLLEQANRLETGDFRCDFLPVASRDLGHLASSLRHFSLHLGELFEWSREALEEVRRTSQSASLAITRSTRCAETQEKLAKTSRAEFRQLVVYVDESRSVVNGCEKRFEQHAERISQISRLVDSVSPWLDAMALATERLSSQCSESHQSLVSLNRHTEELLTRSVKSSRQILELSDLVLRAQGTAGESASVSQNVLSSAKEGMMGLRSRLEGLMSIQESISWASQSIGGLGERSQEIGNILGVITSIAKQTNMLSLNASIIASQAGEHGPGFTIIAEEIRALAEKTSSYTEMVHEIVSSIVSGTEKAIEAMMVCFERLSAEMESSRTTERLLEAIAADTNQLQALSGNSIELVRRELEVSGLVSERNENFYKDLSEVAKSLNDERARHQSLLESILDISELLRGFRSTVGEHNRHHATSSLELGEIRDYLQRLKSELGTSRPGLDTCLTKLDQLDESARETREISLTVRGALDQVTRRVDEISERLGQF